MLGNSLQFMSRENNLLLSQKPTRYRLLWSVFANIVTSNIDSATATRRGVFFNAGSPFIGKVIRRISFPVRISAGAPTGTYSFTLRDSGDSIIATLGTYDIATTLTLGIYRNIRADFGPQVIPSGGRLLIEFTGGDTSNRLSLPQSNVNLLDSNTQDTRFLVSYTQDATRIQSSRVFS